MSDATNSIAVLHLISAAYVIACLTSDRYRLPSWLGTLELTALLSVLFVAIDYALKPYAEPYSVWYFTRNTIGGIGLAWLMLERLHNRRR